MMGTRSNMAPSVLTLLLCLVFSSCLDSTSKKMSTQLIDIKATASEGMDVVNTSASIEMDHLEFDFGTIVAGKRITHSFSFINRGDAPLLLANVHAPCGCTVAKDWPKTPIEPGQGGEILVEFNSADRTGKQNKIVNIVTNSRPSMIELKLTGDVIGPDYTPSDIDNEL